MFQEGVTSVYKVGFARPDRKLRPHLEKVFGTLNWVLCDLDRVDAIWRDIHLVLVSTAIELPKSGAVSTAFNYEWREIVHRIRERDATIPVAMVTSIPSNHFDGMLKPMLEARLGEGVQLVKVEEGAQGNPALGLPKTLVVIGEADMNARKGPVDAQLIGWILDAHIRNRRSV